MQEEYNEREEEYFSDWLSDHYKEVEEEFWARIPPEDHPLDDDMPDYIDRHNDEYMEIAREYFYLWLEEERVRW